MEELGYTKEEEGDQKKKCKPKEGKKKLGGFDQKINEKEGKEM